MFRQVVCDNPDSSQWLTYRAILMRRPIPHARDAAASHASACSRPRAVVGTTRNGDGTRRRALFHHKTSAAAVVVGRDSTIHPSHRLSDHNRNRILPHRMSTYSIHRQRTTICSTTPRHLVTTCHQRLPARARSNPRHTSSLRVGGVVALGAGRETRSGGGCISTPHCTRAIPAASWSRTCRTRVMPCTF